MSMQKQWLLCGWYGLQAMHKGVFIGGANELSTQKRDVANDQPKDSECYRGYN